MRHDYAGYIFKGPGRPFQWRFDTGDGPARFDPAPRIIVSDGDAYLALARSGLAIKQDLSFNLAADLRAVTLVQVLANCVAAGPPVSLVYLEGRHLPHLVRAAFEFLAERLSA